MKARGSRLPVVRTKPGVALKEAGARLRLLLYITPSGIGGAEIHFLSLLRKLKERGHQVIVVCPEGRPLAARLKALDLDLRLRRTHGKLDFLTLRWLTRLVREEKIDVIHTHLSTASLFGGMVGRRTGVPVVSTVHGLNTKTCYLRATLVVAVSEAVKRHLTAQGFPAGKVRVVTSGLGLEFFARSNEGEAFRRGLGIPIDAPVLVASGRLAPEKGHQLLLQSLFRLLKMANFPGLRLLIVGEGKLRAQLVGETSRLGLDRTVVFTGFLTDVVPALQAADIFVLPSLREGLSLATIEAMALGKPVVATHVGGLPEVICEGETGLLVPPGDGEKLTKALYHLLTQPDLARQMGEAGRQRALDHFNLEDMVTRIEEVYREALRLSPGPR